MSWIVEQVAQKILVTDTSLSQPAEVRIQVKQEVLADTEIRIRDSASGIEIEFVTNSPSSAAMIDRGRPDLENLLNQRLDTPVQVSVIQPENDTDTGQGRSRQPYVPNPELLESY